MAPLCPPMRRERPGALGIFSGAGDFTQTGDSQFVYGVRGLVGSPDTRPKGVQWLAVYVGSADPKDPVLSPFFADLHGVPPTLFLTSCTGPFCALESMPAWWSSRASITASGITPVCRNHGKPTASWLTFLIPALAPSSHGVFDGARQMKMEPGK